MRRYLVAAVAACTALPVPAGAAGNTFRGACTARGEAVLTGPFLNWDEVTVVAHGYCTGRFNGRLVVATPIDIDAVATPREVDDLGFALTARGVATITFTALHDEQITLLLHHVTPPTGIDRGAEGGIALVNEIPISPLECGDPLASTGCTGKLLILVQALGVRG